MKKMLKVVLLAMVLVVVMAGCGKKEEVKPITPATPATPTTPATILESSFVEIMKSETDLSVIAKKLSEDEIIQTKMIVEKKTTSDFLSGFNSEIKNFDEAYVMQPVINSIPFIMYVFKTDKASLLETELKDNANPRWNICVEADETVIKVVDNYVFFVMAPKSFEE